MELGAHVRTVGRDESVGRQRGVAFVLGTLSNMLVGPFYGFPLLKSSAGMVGFFVVFALVDAALVLLFGRLRVNRALHLHEQGLVFVEGERRETVPYADLRRLRYDPRTRRLTLEREGIPPLLMKLSAPLGAAAAREIGARLG